MCEFERGTGAREIYPTLYQRNKVRSKNCKGFSGRNRKLKRFFRTKTGDLQKKGLHCNFKGFSGRYRKFKRFFRPKTGDLRKKGLHCNFKGFSGRYRKFKRFFRPKTGDLRKKGLHPKNVTKSGVSPQKTLIWASICAPEAPSLLISSGHSPRLGGHKQPFGGARPRYAPPWRRVWNVVKNKHVIKRLKPQTKRSE